VTFWEELGERVGYGIAALIYGPAAALERSHRRAFRRALRAYCSGIDTVRMTPKRSGVVSRRITLAHDVSAEVELDLASRHAWFEVQLERRPAFVEAIIDKHLGSIDYDPKIAIAEGELRLSSRTMPADDQKAMLSAIARGPLERLTAVEIVVDPERVVILTPAPTTAEQWSVIERGCLDLVAWIGARWPISYR
jgi:hypothetical protein